MLPSRKHELFCKRGKKCKFYWVYVVKNARKDLHDSVARKFIYTIEIHYIIFHSQYQTEKISRSVKWYLKKRDGFSKNDTPFMVKNLKLLERS